MNSSQDMPYEVKTTEWENPATQQDEIYEQGITQEWASGGGLKKRQRVKERNPVREAEARYATRCVGRVKIDSHEYAIVRHFWTYLISDSRDNYEYFTFEPVYEVETGEYVEDITPGSRVDVIFHIDKSNPDEISFRTRHSSHPLIIEVDWPAVVEDVSPFLKEELSEGKPMFEFAEQPVEN